MGTSFLRATQIPIALKSVRPAAIALLVMLMPGFVSARFTTYLFADEKDESKDEQIEKWMALYGDIASKLRVTVQESPEELLTLETKPLLTYTNPIRSNGQHGCVYLWTGDGRPRVIGSYWSKETWGDPNQRRVVRELHSLSPGGASAAVGENTVWNVGEPGTKFHAISDSTPPAETNPRRLLQLKAIARSFTAEIADKERRIGHEQYHLRRLPRPLFRYGGRAVDDKLLDGVVFGFVMGTDPELFLLIEALRTSSGSAWQFAAARFTDHSLVLRHEGTKVWSCPLVNPTTPSAPYSCLDVLVRPSLIKEKRSTDHIGHSTWSARQVLEAPSTAGKQMVR